MPLAEALAFQRDSLEKVEYERARVPHPGLHDDCHAVLLLRLAPVAPDVRVSSG